MTTIYLTRHGETEWNIQHRMQGRLDSPLTELGKRQALLLGKRLADRPIDVIYSSTAPRAIATAGLIKGERSIPTYTHEGFCEMSLGEWEGKKVSVLKETEQENCLNFLYHPQLFVPPKGAESFEELQQRLLAALTEVARKHRDQSILVVSHGVAMRNMRAALNGLPLETLWHELYKPTALSMVEHNAESNAFNIIFWNDTSHYEP